MNVEIRSATATDVPALAELRRAIAFEDPEPASELRDDFDHAFDEIVTAGIASGRWTVWVAEAEGKIVCHAYVGLIEKIPLPTRENRWIGYVTNVYTRPEHRGRGVGAALLDRVTSWAAERDVELLVVFGPTRRASASTSVPASRAGGTRSFGSAHGRADSALGGGTSRARRRKAGRRTRDDDRGSRVPDAARRRGRARDGGRRACRRRDPGDDRRARRAHPGRS